MEEVLERQESMIEPTDPTQLDLVGLDAISTIEDHSYTIINNLRERVFSPNTEKELNVRFSITQAAMMVGRSSTAIRNYEKEGKLPAPSLDDRGRRTGYTLTDINRMRQLFNTAPNRSSDDETVILAVQNFKGGVGKSTITTHLSQYLALAGYRVCVIDCDSQASTTNLFGINPDLDLTEEDTVYPFLMHGGQKDLRYAVRQTYWDGIDLIPANLSLYNAEYQLAAKVSGATEIFDRLKVGVDSIAADYDVIIIDPPPALGMISLSVLRAANALLVPVPPSTVDFSSTAHFFSMLTEVLETLKKYGMESRYKFLKVVASKVNDQKSAHVEITKMMRAVYGSNMLEASLKDSAEIDNANARLMSVYELTGPQTSKGVHDRCKAYLNAVCGEIELHIRKTWPSHSEMLAEQGLV